MINTIGATSKFTDSINSLVYLIFVSLAICQAKAIEQAKNACNPVRLRFYASTIYTIKQLSCKQIRFVDEIAPIVLNGTNNMRETDATK